MKKIPATVPVVFLLIAFLQGACGPSSPTPEETIAACRRDFPQGCCLQSDCMNGTVCDFSYVCGLGGDHQLTCDPPTGDRKCHSRCEPPRSCLSGQTCKSLSFFNGSDFGEAVSLCYGN